MIGTYFVCIPFSNHKAAAQVLKRVEDELGYGGEVRFNQNGTDIFAPTPPVPELQVGQRWLFNGDEDEYLLAEVDIHKYALVNLRTGNRWANAVEDINKVFGTCPRHWTLVKDEG